MRHDYRPEPETDTETETVTDVCSSVLQRPGARLVTVVNQRETCSWVAWRCGAMRADDVNHAGALLVVLVETSFGFWTWMTEETEGELEKGQAGVEVECRVS